MKLPALLREQPNLHQFNLYCLTQGGKVSHREEKAQTRPLLLDDQFFDTCWERADLLAVLCVMFSLCFYHVPIWCCGSGMVLDLSIPDLCLSVF